MSGAQATAQCSAQALLGTQPLCGMQAPRVRSLASAPLPDPASRVPRATLRGAPRAKRGDATVANVAGCRQFGVPVIFDLSEAAGMSRATRWWA
jgi:hypothetical protein